mgnify:CR=1 FL=1
MACVVCNQTKNVIVCPNGHHQCGRCLLKRIQSIYEEGRSAFHNDDAQKCFTCRCKLTDEHIKKYCPVYKRMLKLVVIRGEGRLCLIRQGYPKHIAKKIANDAKNIQKGLNLLSVV